MADITEREIFQGIISEKFKRGIIGIDPDDVQAVFDEIGDSFSFYCSSFESEGGLKNALAGLVPQHSEKALSACFTIDISPDTSLEYIDSIATALAEFFLGSIVWSVSFDSELKHETFKLNIYFGAKNN